MKELKENSKGILTVEATISLTIFLFFMMFILNFAQVYQAQNYVNHGLLQTGKTLAFKSFAYDQQSLSHEIRDILGMFNILGSREAVETEYKWRGKDYASVVKYAFGYCTAGSADITHANLLKFGILEGIDSLDFTGTMVQDDDLIINVKYDVRLRYSIFNFNEVTLHQRVVCGLWK